MQIDEFLLDAAGGTLPAVSWVVPNDEVSEHPPNSVSLGQAYVPTLVNGFYDHVPPPAVDGQGFGFRVPGFSLSPWTKKGTIDQQTLSHGAPS